ncbi:aromatic-ring-hydroxylating dioxygenase subunit beta [Sulfitobacter sp. F26204]|uniref:aromatic-ring-hydroxylating dioxygenase subunit beta n=1 Tax=Sulfitobacter sp. F26204 TaxID=2996014 RepID=UPI00225DDDE0|nr:aromatic-ring-hydroxylating dioxygenase subunit beta [Sulfitobacter sp. F26204]MCX7561720.1 aromatic-ring-hydroxylating dioxygenase subunit beta [Sulfitobacter sp. F26204]
MSETTKTKAGISQAEAIDFVWREADVLDRADYQTWLKMWSKHGLYIIPINPDETDFENTLNITYDDAGMRRMRVDRLSGGFAISAAPAARTVRLLSRFVETDCGPETISLRAAFFLTEDKLGRQIQHTGTIEYDLIREGGALVMSKKVVRLINANGELNAISYLF